MYFRINITGEIEMNGKLNVKKIRTELLRWSQERLARELKVSVRTVWRWEQGQKMNDIAYDALEKLVERFKSENE